MLAAAAAARELQIERMTLNGLSSTKEFLYYNNKKQVDHEFMWVGNSVFKAIGHWFCILLISQFWLTFVAEYITLDTQILNAV